jgi:hypothetical protein
VTPKLPFRRWNVTLRLCLAAVLGLAAGLAAGCGDGKDPAAVEKLPTVPARGVVKYKKEPVKDASVSFQSLDGKVASRGRTDGAGSFVLSTYGQEDGAPPGKYKVVVAAGGPREVEPGVLAPEPPGGFKSPIPTKYASAQTTDILVEVKQGEPNDFTIELK